jgi:hypothetical protein
MEPMVQINHDLSQPARICLHCARDGYERFEATRRYVAKDLILNSVL